MDNFEWIDRSLYPFESKFIEIEGRKIHYVDEGTGPVILFSHGTPEWSFGWRDLIKSLRSDFRCVAADLLGMGLSEKPQDADLSCAAHASRLEVLIEKLDLRDICIVANDFGLSIALSYAIKHPENVRKISIFNGWMWSVREDRHYAIPMRLFGGWWGRMMYQRFNFPVNVIMPAAFGNRKKFLTPEIHRHYKRALPNAAARRATYTFVKEMFRASEWWTDLWNKRSLVYDKLGLIFWGMKDTFVPNYELDKWAAAFPEARVVRLPEAGHFAQEEAPELMSEELRKEFMPGKG